jgi:nicotinamidase-related amidase
MLALLLINVQKDFLPPSGALAVAGGHAILAGMHRLLDEGEWNLIVASQVRRLFFLFPNSTKC